MVNNELTYIGYVSCLNGHIMRDETTGWYELWANTAKIDERPDMGFIRPMTMFETENYIDLAEDIAA